LYKLTLVAVWLVLEEEFGQCLFRAHVIALNHCTFSLGALAKMWCHWFNASFTEQAGLVGVESRHPDDLDLVDNRNLFVSFLLNNSPYVINHLNERLALGLVEIFLQVQ